MCAFVHPKNVRPLLGRMTVGTNEAASKIVNLEHDDEDRLRFLLLLLRPLLLLAPMMVITEKLEASTIPSLIYTLQSRIPKAFRLLDIHLAGSIPQIASRGTPTSSRTLNLASPIEYDEARDPANSKFMTALSVIGTAISTTSSDQTVYETYKTNARQPIS